MYAAVCRRFFDRPNKPSTNQSARVPQHDQQQALAQQIITPILSAVIHIHANGFLHRDLKPENILCSRSDGADDLVVKLCDFGLTCHLPPPGTLLNGTGSVNRV